MGSCSCSTNQPPPISVSNSISVSDQNCVLLENSRYYSALSGFGGIKSNLESSVVEDLLGQVFSLTKSYEGKTKKVELSCFDLTDNRQLIQINANFNFSSRDFALVSLNKPELFFPFISEIRGIKTKIKESSSVTVCRANWDLGGQKLDMSRLIISDSSNDYSVIICSTSALNGKLDWLRKTKSSNEFDILGATFQIADGSANLKIIFRGFDVNPMQGEGMINQATKYFDKMAENCQQFCVKEEIPEGWDWVQKGKDFTSKKVDLHSRTPRKSENHKGNSQVSRTVVTSFVRCVSESRPTEVELRSLQSSEEVVEDSDKNEDYIGYTGEGWKLRSDFSSKLRNTKLSQLTEESSPILDHPLSGFRCSLIDSVSLDPVQTSQNHI